MLSQGSSPSFQKVRLWLTQVGAIALLSVFTLTLGHAPANSQENPETTQPPQPDANSAQSGTQSGAPVLKTGSQGAQVTQLQALLKLWGFYAGAVDGTYQESTAAAVAAFQQAAGLQADGVVGPDTWNRLLPPSPAGGDSAATTVSPSASAAPTATSSFPSPTVPSPTVSPAATPIPSSTTFPSPTASTAASTTPATAVPSSPTASSPAAPGAATTPFPSPTAPSPTAPTPPATTTPFPSPAAPAAPATNTPTPAARPAPTPTPAARPAPTPTPTPAARPTPAPTPTPAARPAPTPTPTSATPRPVQTAPTPTPAGSETGNPGSRSSTSDSSVPVDFPILKLGMHGPAVSRLQERLRTLGFFNGSVDGVFGEETQSAVKAAQQKYELEPDGIVGPATWTTLLQ